MKIAEWFGRRVRQDAQDLPGAIIPTSVISRFPLLGNLYRLIGFDLRRLTRDKLQPVDIGIYQTLDGSTYNGQALIHANYFVNAETGEDVNGRPFWTIDVFMNHVNPQYMQELCARLVSCYGTPYVSEGAGKYTGGDLALSQEKPAVSLKCWLNQYLDGYALKRCELWLRSYEFGRIANLHFHVYEQ
ncbi:hypothetical protein ACFOTA_06845 [Chitinophaga sp. GCM10012297]|uniref:Uncharacterized protein n=1 Tax=Chitinophaga chungangae TaxID=2821488 RepID=A0ABS3YB84_9BACT|nr:hypothetical protein [Chitinophaga chungangae]MBO9151916.1 hypothetical protein [Chitinophaga chungangae]